MICFSFRSRQLEDVPYKAGFDVPLVEITVSICIPSIHMDPYGIWTFCFDTA